MQGNLRYSHPYVVGASLTVLVGFVVGASPALGDGPCTGTSRLGDPNADGNLDWTDYAGLAACLSGPDVIPDPGCDCFTGQDGSDVDLFDVSRFFAAFSLPPGCIIDGSFVAEGVRDAFPFNCRICVPDQNPSGWSLVAVGTLCNSGSGDVCDPPEFCNGVTGQCPEDVFLPPNQVCRAGSGDECDPPEYCPGVPDQPCPEDQVSPKGLLCRPGSGDVCDPDEFCTGVAREACPQDVLKSTDFVCRAGSGDMCDPDEVCPGVPGHGCPDDTVAKAGTVCNPGSGDLCDPDEVCSGVPGESCPDDRVESSKVLCRDKAGDCDVADYCSGIADEPCVDVKLGPETVCRAKAGACDVEEVCDGIGSDCPPDAFKDAGSVCRSAGQIIDETTWGTIIVGPGECDVPETCTGDSASCPPDEVKPAGIVCRPRQSRCDVEAEVCDGSGKNCPFDTGPNGQQIVCRLPAGPCDVPEFCDQADAAYPGCPPDTVKPEGTLCRPPGPAGPYPNIRACDVPEFCDGASINCPTNEYLPFGSACVRSDGSDGQCTDVGIQQPKCVAVGVIPDGARCNADFECVSGNCSEMIDRSMRCIPADFVGYGGRCDGKDSVPEGDYQARVCYDGDSNQLYCCKGARAAVTGETGTCQECCLSEGSGIDADVDCANAVQHGSRTACCNGRCVDWESDPYNCGECGMNCLDAVGVCKLFVECQPSNPDGLPEPGQCIYQNPCGTGNACWDSCVLCASVGNCDTCQSVPSCVDTTIDVNTGLCNPCSSNAGCADGQYCASGCGGDTDVSLNIICLDPGYCVEQAGDCVPH